MQNYETPVLEVISFDTEDVICTSSGSTGGGKKELPIED